MVPADEDEFLTAVQVATLAHTNQRNVNRWARDGRLPIALRTPTGRRLYRRSDIERLLFPEPVDTEEAS